MRQEMHGDVGMCGSLVNGGIVYEENEEGDGTAPGKLADDSGI